MNEIETAEPQRKIPPDVVDLLRDVLRRMVATYGRAFWAQYKGATESDVRVVWARELRPYAHRQHVITWAFENLPDTPPNAISFRNLCRRCPARPEKQPETVLASPERIAIELAGARVATQAPTRPRTAWAEKIIARHEAGENISPGVLRHARSVHRTTTVVDPVET